MVPVLLWRGATILDHPFDPALLVRTRRAMIIARLAFAGPLWESPGKFQAEAVPAMRDKVIAKGNLHVRRTKRPRMHHRPSIFGEYSPWTQDYSPTVRSKRSRPVMLSGVLPPPEPPVRSLRSSGRRNQRIVGAATMARTQKSIIHPIRLPLSFDNLHAGTPHKSCQEDSERNPIIFR